MDILSLLLKILSGASALTGVVSFIMAWKGIAPTNLSPQYILPAGIGLVLFSILLGVVDFFSNKSADRQKPALAISVTAYTGSPSSEELIQILTARAASINDKLKKKGRN